MKKAATASAIACAMVLPTTAGAYELIGKKLELYGKAHVSLDAVDNGTHRELAIASNSSRLGFKGVTAISDELDALYQIESKIVFDEGGADFAGRNTFVGLGGGFGQVLVGNQDTPFKEVRSTFDMFDDTVADVRNLLGVYSIGGGAIDIGNRRAKNSIQYLSPVFAGFSLNGLYSTAYDDQQTAEGLENNNFSLYSVSVTYAIGGLTLQGGYERGNANRGDAKTNGVRLVTTYTFDAFKLGAVYERIKQGDNDRNAWGLSGGYTFGANILKLQYVGAGETGSVNNSGATQLSFGLDHKLAKNTTLYGVYNLLINGDASSYRIKGGHDTDVYQVANPGDDIHAFSVGLIYKF